MSVLAVLDVRYFQRGDGRYLATVKCTSCPLDESLKIIPVIVHSMESSFIELVAEIDTGYCLTEWGCRRAVKRILKRIKKHVPTLQCKELYSELIVL